MALLQQKGRVYLVFDPKFKMEGCCKKAKLGFVPHHDGEPFLYLHDVTKMFFWRGGKEGEHKFKLE
jgi:hypothetical protein